MCVCGGGGGWGAFLRKPPWASCLGCCYHCLYSNEYVEPAGSVCVLGGGGGLHAAVLYTQYWNTNQNIGSVLRSVIWMIYLSVRPVLQLWCICLWNLCYMVDTLVYQAFGNVHVPSLPVLHGMALMPGILSILHTCLIWMDIFWQQSVQQIVVGKDSCGILMCITDFANDVFWYLCSVVSYVYLYNIPSSCSQIYLARRPLGRASGV